MNFSGLHRSLLFVALWLTITTVATTNATAQNSSQPPDDMVLIPAGPFLMGNNNDFYDNDFDEQPRHVVDLPPFFMSIYPVTNQDYKAFIDATGHRHPRYWSDSGEIPVGKEKHPVTGVNSFDATAFATWKGHRLPTEQEWEKASRGTEGLRWPWGNHFEISKVNVGQRSTTPVGTYPQGCNEYGLCDISGNVWEWTTTWYAPYPDAPPNRAILRFLNDQFLSVHGGSYGSDMGSARGADRGIKKPEELGPSLGFRTVMDVPGYAGYREALQTIELARDASQAAALDISEYEEHAASRKLMAAAATELSNAEKAFAQKQFMQSGIIAQHSISKADQAQQLALNFRRDFQIKKAAGTAEVLRRLEVALTNLPEKQTPYQQILIEQAENHLQLGQQLEAEGGWGYAQMHGFIGMSILKRLASP